MTAKQDKRVDACAEAVREARDALGRWETEAQSALEALTELDNGMGEQVLDNPDRAEELTSTMERLRARVRLAESAAAAARPRIVEAERAYLAAEADRLEGDLAPVRAALQAHNARTQELLAQLEEHEGKYVLEVEALLNAYDPGASGPRHFPAPKSGRMRGQVTRLERQVRVLRDLVEGLDPQPLMNEWNVTGNVVDYPACIVGPAAVVPWRQHLASRAELEALIGA